MTFDWSSKNQYSTSNGASLMATISNNKKALRGKLSIMGNIWNVWGCPALKGNGGVPSQISQKDQEPKTAPPLRGWKEPAKNSKAQRISLCSHPVLSLPISTQPISSPFSGEISSVLAVCVALTRAGIGRHSPHWPLWVNEILCQPSYPERSASALSRGAIIHSAKITSGPWDSTAWPDTLLTVPYSLH